MSFSRIFGLLKDTFSQFNEDKAPRLGASLAYYTVFSLAPLLVIAIGIAGLVFGAEAARGQIMNSIGGLVGDQGAQGIQAMVQGASQQRTGGIVATIIGIVALLFGASGVFGALQDSLNTMWEVQPKPGRGIMGLIKSRFFSFTMVLGTGFLLLVSLIVSTGLSAFGAWLGNAMPGGEGLWQVINFIFSLAVITVIFALVFKYIPEAKIAWRDVWIGAFITALLFTIGKFVIGLYLGHSAFSSSYGAAGSLLVLLLWVYYSAQILFFGAEFTQVYANTYGSRMTPKPGAVPMTEEARAEQGMARKPDVVTAAQTDRSVEAVAKEREGERADQKPQPAVVQTGRRDTASGNGQQPAPSNGSARNGELAQPPAHLQRANGASSSHNGQQNGGFSLKEGVKALGLGAAVLALQKFNARRHSTE
ncbi:MAG: YihY/virulence factor BrkB family protein [Anaerolineae bacterium]